MSSRLLLSSGEFRGEMLRLFDPGAGLDIITSGPGHLGAFRGMAEMHANPTARIGRSAAFAFRNALLSTLARDVDVLPQTSEWRHIIFSWCKALESGNAKCYHFASSPLFTRLISRVDETIVCPAPIADATVNGETELNIQLSGEEHIRAREWFRSILEASEDITTQIQDVLSASWAGATVAPEAIYYKVLSQYFWATIEGLDLKADDNPLLGQLTDFQLEAYQYAKGVMRRYGAVFLADVVGLGKTYIALALLRHLQDRYGEHAVVIAPPNVLHAWRSLAAEYRVELQTVSIGKLDDLDLYRDREIVVIDESHNFRNAGTQRYERIQTWLRPEGAPSRRKVVLLSATPQNNHPNDVKHQLAFFPDNYSRLPYRGESLDHWFSQVQNGHASLTDLLQHVVVRRTRRFIQSAYPNATLRVRNESGGGYERVPLQFPMRQSGSEQCLRYSINETYGANLYDQVLETLSGLHYSPYGLSSYLTERGASDPRVAGIRRSGNSIRGLYKVLLLKRLESSVVAFKGTLGRLESRLRSCLDALNSGKVTVRIQEHSATAADDDLQDLTSEEISVPASLFDAGLLRNDLSQDLHAVSSLGECVAALDESRDAKVARLEAYFEERRPSEHKTIVFTQFADTAEHLAHQLGQRFGRTAAVTGARGNAMGMARRFSPKSNRCDVTVDRQIDLLISTDALSEGVNLQDADTLINYDLHWNPVRLIQRAGRVDRIGSENEVICVASFLAEAALESALGMETVLRRRIAEFLAVFGEDSHVLPSDEQLDPDSAVSAFTGRAFEEEDDDMDGLSRHVERLLQLRRERPDYYGHILELRAGLHGVSASTLDGVAAARLGWFWQFWVRQAGGARETVDDLRGLDILYAHAEAGESQSFDAEIRHLLGEFVNLSRDAFEPVAAAFREQRLHPRLTPPEVFVMEQLEAYRRQCVASRREHVEEQIEWVRGGYAQVPLRRVARLWKKESLPPETVFGETRVLFARFPPSNESLGESEIMGAVMADPEHC